VTTGPVPEKKKGLHPLAWVAIGCGGLVLVGGIVAVIVGLFVFNKARQFAKDVEENPVAATARFIAATNPDIELVEDDREAQSVTFRNVKTGETTTVSYEDIQKGRVTFSSKGQTATLDAGGTGGEGGVTIKTDEGTATFGVGAGATDWPSWLPAYPGVTPKGAFSTNTADARAGAFSFRTSSSLSQVGDFYAREIQKIPLKINVRTTTPEGFVLAAAEDDGSRAVNVVASRDGNETQVTVQFTESSR